MINNEGGGIFRIIDGPSGTEALGPFFEGVHEMNAEGIAQTFGLPYYFCQNAEELEAGLDRLYASDRASILEVRTPRKENDRVLKELFRHLESQNPSS
jgi:2-succinyl-5-enolpyruvyl-6-hydroxy-3-cyclohexene-1-carboxylate synthase